MYFPNGRCFYNWFVLNIWMFYQPPFPHKIIRTNSTRTLSLMVRKDLPWPVFLGLLHHSRIGPSVSLGVGTTASLAHWTLKACYEHSTTYWWATRETHTHTHTLTDTHTHRHTLSQAHTHTDTHSHRYTHTFAGTSPQVARSSDLEVVWSTESSWI